VYLSFWQNGAFSKHLVVRTASDPNAVAALVRREVHAVDPTASVEHFTTMAQIRRDSIAPRTFAMRLLIGSRSSRPHSRWSASTGCCRSRSGRE
jgi:putative ABC transport system permease protein